MPSTARPPLMWSMVVIILATSAGLRNVLAPTIRPDGRPLGGRGQGADGRVCLQDRPLPRPDDGIEVVPGPERVVAEPLGALLRSQPRWPVGVLVPAVGAQLDGRGHVRHQAPLPVVTVRFGVRLVGSRRGMKDGQPGRAGRPIRCRMPGHGSGGRRGATDRVAVSAGQRAGDSGRGASGAVTGRRAVRQRRIREPLSGRRSVASRCSSWLTLVRQIQVYLPHVQRSPRRVPRGRSSSPSRLSAPMMFARAPSATRITTTPTGSSPSTTTLSSCCVPV